MRDISTIMAEERVNISELTSRNHNDHKVIMDFTMETEGLAQLSRLLKKVEAVKGVVRIVRVGDEAAKGGDQT